MARRRVPWCFWRSNAVWHSKLDCFAMKKFLTLLTRHSTTAAATASIAAVALSTYGLFSSVDFKTHFFQEASYSLLGALLGVGVSFVGIYISSRMSRTRKAKIFISYNHSESEYVSQLAEAMRTAEFSTFVDKDEIKIGENINQRIKELIKDSDLFITTWSDNSRNSRWLQLEFEEAQRRKIPIIPISIDGSIPPPPLGELAFIDGSRGTDHLINKLKETISAKS